VPVFEALADPTRRRILELLAERERVAGELAGEFRVSRPAISRHLRVLREAGLVSYRGEAQRRVYRFEPGRLSEVDRWVERRRRTWTERLDALARHLEKRPTRKGKKR
jgi:DNA-binding transcriptional ArsR family regulator